MTTKAHAHLMEHLQEPYWYCVGCDFRASTNDILQLSANLLSTPTQRFAVVLPEVGMSGS